MNKLLTLFLLSGFFGGLSTTVMAEDKPMLPPALQQIHDEGDRIYTTTIHVPLVEEGSTQWQLTTTEQAVLLGKLARLPESLNHPDDAIFREVNGKRGDYKGVSIAFAPYEGDAFPNLVVFNGAVVDDRGRVVRQDPGRELELWILGTAKVRKEQLLALDLLPIFTFNQCVLLGNVVVHTTPRQCLLPNNDILLEVVDPVEPQALKIRNFDECLEDGKALIDVFPRRCLAAGGRVFTEPPRVPQLPSQPQTLDVKETSATKPKAKKAKTEKPAVRQAGDVDIEEFLKEYKADQSAF